MRKFNQYYLAVYGSLNDKWELINEFEDEINLLSHNDEDLKNEILVSVIMSFNYVTIEVYMYLDLNKIKKL